MGDTFSTIIEQLFGQCVRESKNVHNVQSERVQRVRLRVCIKCDSVSVEHASQIVQKLRV